MLFAGYPFLVRQPMMTIPPFSPHLLEPTARLGPLLPLGLWGAVLLFRRGGRLGRLWSAQLLAASILWVGYLGLSALQLARERDEIDYWLRILIAIGAGFGVWDLVCRAATLVSARPLRPEVAAAALSALALPWTVPYWWEPARMDSYFSSSLAPAPDTLVLPSTYLRERTGRRQVVAGDRDFARYAAALGARQSLLSERIHFPKDAARRFEAEELLVRGTDGDAVRAAAAPYRVAYLVVTPRLLEAFPGVTLADIEARPFLRRVAFAGDPAGDYVAIYGLQPAGS
jgi:hypothetical protein